MINVGQERVWAEGLCQCGCGGQAPIATRTIDGYRKGQAKRFIRGHANRKHDFSYNVEDTGFATPCWIFRGELDTKGYGRIGGAQAQRRYYEKYVGEIPSRLELDHLCRVHACVNPSHLEPVTNNENKRRGLQVVRAKEMAKKKRKLTPQQVREIRASSESQYVLGRRYRVSPPTIFQARNRNTYKEVA